MAEVVGTAPTLGAELKDGFKPASAWAGNGISWLEDIQQFYRERSAIEKEYSQKLSSLAKRYFDKKNKKSASISVGDTPAMAPGSLESASMTTWTTQLNALEKRAEEHDRYANNLTLRIADPMKVIGVRLEELRKRHIEFADRLERERDASFSDLKKMKGKYDSSCQELEAKRKKTESSFEKAKAQSAYQQQIHEMNNVKNAYLININVANKLKEVYYHQYIPEVMDSLQDLSEFRTAKVNELWTAAMQLEGAMLKSSQGIVDHVAEEVTRNKPYLDSMMYIRHNMSAWQEPPDKVFEPSPVWHDDATMVIDEVAKIYLRNMLNKSKGQLSDLRREVDKKRREVDGIRKVKERVREGQENQDEIDVVRQLFAMQEDLHDLDRKRLTAEAETSTITAAVGDVTLGAMNHNFKAQTFKIPSSCDLCGDKIWGISAKGMECRDCGYTCHTKCEMKVPAECPGEQNKEERKKLKSQRQAAATSLLRPDSTSQSQTVDLPALSRSNTVNSTTSGYSASVKKPISVSGLSSSSTPRTPADEPSIPSSEPDPPRASTSSAASGGAPRKNRVMAPPPAAYVSAGAVPTATKPLLQKGKMLYAFDASGDGELTVPEGREVVVLAPDDGSGWAKVRLGYKEGIVPSSYLEMSPAPTATPATITPIAATPETTQADHGVAKKKGPAVAPRRGAKKLRYVEALYAYTAQSDSEHSMTEGERFVLSKEDPGDGWVEVEKGGAVKSVPASYVQMV
ncbi:Protein BZZ1 [Ceratocystis lukuohia]|uniref:Protein BZZ1 n=2 Tax=Ceratocystis TaxID=5157 RepID=A0A2C5X225_9PEZI|nr:Protein BZZ1 [Ceratocystis fimbriata CBS 114723]